MTLPAFLAGGAISIFFFFVIVCLFLNSFYESPSGIHSGPTLAYQAS